MRGSLFLFEKDCVSRFCRSFFGFDFADILLSKNLTFAKSQVFGQLFGRKFKAES
jgi:hypothetical protein